MRKPIVSTTPERVAKLLLVSGIPPAYREWTLDTYVVTEGNREAYDAALAFSDRSLYIGGVSGCGKTRLAVGIALRMIERGVVAKFANVPDLLERCLAKDEDERPDLDRLIAPTLCRVLVLDDIGMSQYTGWKQDEAVRTLYRVINGRIENGVPTIYTTNLPLGGDEMRRRLGDPIVSRIARESEQVVIRT
jgi:DNA replication protein DnaC